MITSHRFAPPAPLPIVGHDAVAQFSADPVGGGGQYDPLEGHFGVDTEMMEERWLHMQVKKTFRFAKRFR